MTKNCLQCNKEFDKPYNESVKAFTFRHKFCSKICKVDFQKGKLVYDNTGKKLTEEHKKKISDSHSGEKAYQWKGGITSNCRKLRKQRMRINGGSYTTKDWEELKNKYNGMCLCCKKFEPEIKLTADHIIPVLLGGTNDISNIQPLCGSCNSRKSTKTTNFIINLNQLSVA